MELPGVHTDQGMEVRVLLAEVRGPAESGYTLPDATTAMQWMHVILQNRIAKPKAYGSKTANLRGIVTARGQFAGFEAYPMLSKGVRDNIEGKLRLANASDDARSQSYQDYINAALTVARTPTLNDPSPGTLVAWRTASARPPGTSFVFFKTLLGNDYYYLP